MPSKSGVIDSQHPPAWPLGTMGEITLSREPWSWYDETDDPVNSALSLTSKTYGKFTIGQDSTATDGVAEYDLDAAWRVAMDLGQPADGNLPAADAEVQR